MATNEEKKAVFIAAYGAAYANEASRGNVTEEENMLGSAESAAGIAWAAVKAYEDDSEYMSDGPSGPVQHTLRELGLADVTGKEGE